MHKVHVFILRLLADSEEEEIIRGVLCPLEGDIEYVFKDGHSLIALLSGLVKGDRKPTRTERKNINPSG